MPLDQASRFGILNVRDDGTVYEFEEKPKKPKSALASMGIYIFGWEKLKQYLTSDEAKKESSNDFGKNVMPSIIQAGQRVFVYPFSGYWRDVGTIESLWEANMDLLKPEPNSSVRSRLAHLRHKSCRAASLYRQRREDPPIPWWRPAVS